MFAVDEADDAAIRRVFTEEGELSAIVELRRRFPGVAPGPKARECVRIIAGWTPAAGAGGPRGSPAAAPVSAAGTASPLNPASARRRPTPQTCGRAGGSPGTAARPTAAINPARRPPPLAADRVARTTAGGSGVCDWRLCGSGASCRYTGPGGPMSIFLPRFSWSLCRFSERPA